MMRPLRPRFMLDHRFTRGHASGYVDGELTVDERRRVEHHASVCPKCRELLASLRRTVIALRRLPSARGGNVAERVVERLRAEASARASP
jgi:anti-sigma factor RsiW